MGALGESGALALVMPVGCLAAVPQGRHAGGGRSRPGLVDGGAGHRRAPRSRPRVLQQLAGRRCGAVASEQAQAVVLLRPVPVEQIAAVGPGPAADATEEHLLPSETQDGHGLPRPRRAGLRFTFRRSETELAISRTHAPFVLAADPLVVTATGWRGVGLGAGPVPGTPAPPPIATTTVPPTSTSLMPSATPTTVPVPVQPPPGLDRRSDHAASGRRVHLPLVHLGHLLCGGRGRDRREQRILHHRGRRHGVVGRGVVVRTVGVLPGAGHRHRSPLRCCPPSPCTAGPSCAIVDGSGHLSTGDGTTWSNPAMMTAPSGPPADPADPGPGHTGSRSAVDLVPDQTVLRRGRQHRARHLVAPAGSTAAQGFAEPGGGVAVQLYQPGRVGAGVPDASTCTALVGTVVLDWNGADLVGRAGTLDPDATGPARPPSPARPPTCWPSWPVRTRLGPHAPVRMVAGRGDRSAGGPRRHLLPDRLLLHGGRRRRERCPPGTARPGRRPDQVVPTPPSTRMTAPACRARPPHSAWSSTVTATTPPTPLLPRAQA